MRNMQDRALEIRRAVPTDCEEVRICIRKAYQHYKGKIVDLPPVDQGVEDEIERQGVWVAVADSQIVACIFLVTKPDYIKVANLAVDPDHQGKGLARKMIRVAEERALSASTPEMRLVTHAQMPENIRLYEHLGWEVVGLESNSVSMKRNVPLKN